MDHTPGTFEVTFDFGLLADKTAFLQEPGVVGIEKGGGGGGGGGAGLYGSGIVGSGVENCHQRGGDDVDLRSMAARLHAWALGIRNDRLRMHTWTATCWALIRRLMIPMANACN